MGGDMMARKRRIRWDRLTVAVLLLVIVIFLFGSCVKRCSSDNDDSFPTADTSEQTGSGSTSSGTTTGSSSASTINLPQIVTDAPPSQTVPIVTETTTQTTTQISGVVLPDSYQAVPMPNEMIHKGSLILVDKDHPCEMVKEELDLVQVCYASDKPDTYEVSYPGHTALNQTALSKFNRLMKAYYAETSNTEIMFNYGWLEEGKEKSNPESSTALDVQLHVKRNNGNYEFVSNITPFSWIFEHMDSYGYVLRYPNDKTDVTGVKGGYTAIRYVGVPHAAYMTANNLCLEEYLSILKSKYSFGQGILEYSTSELTYNIYYFPANKIGTTEVPIPKNGSYEISGDNCGGFIVTVVVG